MILLSHVDDMDVLAAAKDFNGLAAFMKEKKLKLKIAGRIDLRGGKFGFFEKEFRRERRKSRNRDELEVHREIR